MKEETTQIKKNTGFLTELKRKVGEAYTEYRSSLSSKKPLGELASYFAVPIDLTRLDDYYVRSLDVDSVTISVVDKSTNTVYRASYKYQTKLIPPNLAAGLYLEVFSNKDAVQTQKLYHVLEGRNWSLTPITSELIITHGERALTFLKFHTDDLSQTAETRPFKISLEVSRPTYDDITKRRPLYSKTMTSPTCRTKGGLREETTISPTVHSTWQRIDVPKTKALYYTIDRTTENLHIFGYIRNLDKVAPKDAQSKIHLIHFIGLTSESNNSGSTLDIYKNGDIIQINYQTDAYPSTHELFNANRGALTPVELDSIIEVLRGLFNDREFIQEILVELREFGHRLRLQSGIESSPNYILAPGRFAPLSFPKIEEIIKIDIGGYFDEAEREYKDIQGRLSNQTTAFSHQMKPNE